MTFDDKCKYCNCTEENACIKEGESCCWILPNICSECFESCTNDEKKDFLSVYEYGTQFECLYENQQKNILEKLEEEDD
jgi:hypothetical protein